MKYRDVETFDGRQGSLQWRGSQKVRCAFQRLGKPRRPGQHAGEQETQSQELHPRKCQEDTGEDCVIKCQGDTGEDCVVKAWSHNRVSLLPGLPDSSLFFLAVFRITCFSFYEFTQYSDISVTFRATTFNLIGIYCYI